MDLLEKFSAVEVKAANRISEADQDFCKRNQAAYETSLTFYTELLRLSTQMKEAQEGLPGNDENGYMISKHDVSIDEHAVKRHLDNLQECFIRNIVDYFCGTYAINIECWKIQRSFNTEEFSESTEEPKQKSPIRYEDIVDLIFKEMDGRSFEEYAMYQLRADCKKAVGGIGGYYERKKAVICFRDSFCYVITRDRYRYTEYEWNLKDNAKSILRALAHFETGKFADYPGPIAHLVTEGTSSTELLGFYYCEKLEELKMYKNGRMDVRFASPALAAEFDEKYLRNLT